jgi:hypothetical protein
MRVSSYPDNVPRNPLAEFFVYLRQIAPLESWLLERDAWPTLVEAGHLNWHSKGWGGCVVWCVVMLMDRAGAEEPGVEGLTRFLKYVSATAALSSNVYKDTLSPSTPLCLRGLALSPGTQNHNLPPQRYTGSWRRRTSSGHSIRGNSRELKFEKELNSGTGKCSVPLASRVHSTRVGQLSRYRNLIVIISRSDHRHTYAWRASAGSCEFGRFDR